MAVNQAYQTYQNNAVNTASPGDLTLMLYNGCLKFIKQAKTGIDEKNIEKKNTNIQKAQQIIQEFMLTLDTNYEISKNLLTMYDYLHHRLIEANTTNDITILEEVEQYVIEFRDTWKEVMKVTRQQQASPGSMA